MIPFLDISPVFNPGYIFSEYLKYLPDQGTLTGKPGGFLFPKPKDPSKGFDIHDPKNMELYQPNQSGIN